MRLPNLLSTALAALGAVALAGQAQAREPRDRGMMMPPPMAEPDDYDYGQDVPPPRPMPHHGYDGPDGPRHHPGDPMPGPWMQPHCGERHHGHAMTPGCGAYPGYPMMGYGVPMMMVPVLRQKPCPERVVEEWVEEPVPVRRRYIPRRHVPDKRVPMTPDKRVPTKRLPY